MAMRDAIIYEDVLNIIASRMGISDTKFKYIVEIICPDLTIRAKKVHVIDITKDYVSKYSDYLLLTLSTTLLEYDNIIYPNREDFKVRLTVIGVDSKTGIEGINKASNLYRGKLTEIEDSKLAYGDTIADNTASKGNELKDFSIQLLDLTLEQLRLKDLATIVRDTTPSDLLHVVMSDYGKFKMCIHEPDNTKSIRQLVIPDDDLSMVDFPAWLQKHGGGVYNHNLGFYCYNDWVHIYPLFNVEPNPERTKVTICSVGPGQMEGIDNTYATEPGKVSILTTGKVEVLDETEKLEYEYGNAVRFQIPNFLTDGVEHNNGETTLTGSGNYVHGVNKDTVNNSKVHNPITNNPYYEVSRIASSRGRRASFQWHNANPAIIYPNMEVLVLYKSGETIHSLRGVILGMDYQSSIGESEGTDGIHSGMATLHTYLEEIPE